MIYFWSENPLIPFIGKTFKGTNYSSYTQAILKTAKIDGEIIKAVFLLNTGKVLNIDFNNIDQINNWVKRIYEGEE